MVGVTSSALLTGLVKAVLSGDTIVVMKQAAPVSGPPPEMRVNLSSLKAPVLSRDGQSDEPYAWASRESLRTRVIGRTVSFRIDYRVPSVNRVFATVYPSATAEKSLNMDVVEAGLARVRRPASQTEDVSPELDALVEAEERATSARTGLHSGSAATTVRKIPAAAANALEGDALVSACRGQTLNAVVEYVANGSVLKLFLRNVPLTSADDMGDRIVTASLSGVQCPGFRRESDDPTVPPKPMPYAANARFLTEVRLQNRDVTVVLDGVDRNGIYFATVEDPTAKLSIAEELLRAGLAKTVGWSLDHSSQAPALRAAERFARDRQVALWKGFQKAAANREAFAGKVVEVVSGDMLVVLDDASGDARRITLASVRSSRAERGNRDRATMPTGPAADAKEALRKRLIGRRVKVKVEYTREPAPDAVRKDAMTFCTVHREGDTKSDVAMPLISNGLLSVVRHRGEEDRAANYEDYLERETKAMEAKRGIHGNAVNAAVRINNLTGPDAKKRSRDVLAGLQRNGPYKGIVEYVSSASRYRIYLPTESMLITLALRAVRCPQSTRRTYGPDGSIREEVPGEPHGDEAADFARERMMQREVEVEIANVDRVGAFLGNVYLMEANGERTDVSSVLLSTGHGYLHESFDSSRDRGGARYVTVEREAREAKRGVWLDYVEEVANRGDDDGDKASAGRKLTGVVSDVGFGGRLFVQDREGSANALSAVETALAGMGLDRVGEVPIASLKPGGLVAAKFSADGRWYRARVLFVHKGAGEVDVRFVDYGNEERVSGRDLRRLGSGAALGLAPVAIEVCLKDLVVPDESDVCGVAAGEYLRDLTYGKEVEVDVMRSEGASKVVGDVLMGGGGSSGGAGRSSDSTGTSSKTSLREELLKSGLARIVRKKDKKSREAFKELRPFEEIGIRSRNYLWNYGEAFESDCDDETPGN